MKITFVSSISDPSLPHPIPASKKIPEWYKLIERYVYGEKKPPTEANGTTGTIKSCMPVLDSMTSGYLILSSADIFIEKKDDSNFYSWADNSAIAFHAQEQLLGYPKLKEKINNDAVPKFVNPWIVKTPENYSCLFLPPLHHDLPFAILPAVVDTDNYFSVVNFPFIPDPDFEGLIPKGTPIAQVIPFRRDNWNMNVEHLEDSKALQKRWFLDSKKMSTQFFDRYKRLFWSSKSYK
jgi:hypothetical protein